LRIGIDLMGSDSSEESFLEAVIHVAAKGRSFLELFVYVHEDRLPRFRSMVEMASLSPDSSSPIHLIPAKETIEMEDAPLHAVRRKRDSSMMMGIEALKRGELDGFVSAGNTGALIASSATRLVRLPSIERPALLALLPTVCGRVAVIDIGGNTSCKPAHLWHFARMGAVYQRLVGGITRPRVGLLNIGTEASKGTREIQEAYLALDEHCGSDEGVDMEFVGNIEGRGAFLGKVDVLVSDGFTGNVFLKTAEGVCTFLLEALSELFGDDPPEEIRGALRTLSGHINYAEYPGAFIAGIEGVVVKCHGSASRQAMESCIEGAICLVERQVIPEMKRAL